MGLFDALTPGVGALASGVLGFLGQQSTNQKNVDIAESNNAWSAQQYATRYQTMVKDMEAAGLNPMLAYSQSPGSSPTAQAVTMQNPVSSAVDAFRSVAGAERDFAGSVHSYASAKGAEQGVKESEARIRQIDANVDKIVEETKNIPTEGQRLVKIVEQLGHQTNLTISQEYLTNAQRFQVLATIDKLKKETSLLDFDVQAAADSANWGRQFKEYGPALEFIIRALSNMRFSK